MRAAVNKTRQCDVRKTKARTAANKPARADERSRHPALLSKPGQAPSPNPQCVVTGSASSRNILARVMTTQGTDMTQAASRELTSGWTDETVASPGGGGWKQLRALSPYLFLAPSLLFLLLFTYLPIGSLLIGSLFESVHGVSGSTFVGLKNYQTVLADPIFRGAALNNLLYGLGSVLPSIAIALFLAVRLERSTRVVSALRGLFFLPTLAPLVAAAALCSFIFMPGVGLIDYYLAKLGLRTLNWIGDPDVALWSLTALAVWKNAGYFMLFFLAGLQAIPEELKEAARLEGASGWQEFRLVTLPLLMPTMAFVAVIAAIYALTQVDHVIVLTKGGPSNSTNLLLYYIYMTAVENFDHGKAAAASALSVAALLAVSLGSMRTMEKGTKHVG